MNLLQMLPRQHLPLPDLHFNTDHSPLATEGGWDDTSAEMSLKLTT